MLLGDSGARLVFSAASNMGMGHSLAAGVRGSENANGWLLALADMPFVLPQTIGRVAEVLTEGGSIVAPSHLGRRGHPVGFARMWFERLCMLDGDIGARHLLDAHADELQLLSCDDPGVCRDVDTPDDL
jgi:molybdenum cofactor cytidylyltransferase